MDAILDISSIIPPFLVPPGIFGKVRVRDLVHSPLDLMQPICVRCLKTNSVISSPGNGELATKGPDDTFGFGRHSTRFSFERYSSRLAVQETVVFFYLLMATPLCIVGIKESLIHEASMRQGKNVQMATNEKKPL